MPNLLPSFLLTLPLVLFTLFWPLSPSHAAPTCRTVSDHTICILTIKRSAKNYWEYRASVKIDDHVFPVERYNCRDRTKINKTGQITPFQLNGAGVLICQLLYR